MEKMLEKFVPHAQLMAWCGMFRCSSKVDPNEYISSIQRLCSFNSRSLAFHWLHSMPEFASSTCQGIVNWISMQLPLQKGRTKSSRRLVEWGNEITKRIQNSVPYSFTSFCLAARSPTRGAVFVDLHSRPGELLSYAQQESNRHPRKRRRSTRRKTKRRTTRTGPKLQ